MERLAIVARLKEGTGTRAAELLERPPPFDLDESGLLRHSIYLSAGEVVFIFEGDQVEWIVDEQLAGQFLHPLLADALDAWRPLVDGPPRIARERFSWERMQRPSQPS
jgi:hypothetical protein